ncbi:sensor histidine kinase [Undibacterium sp. Di24W]|uniref:sensor histidine kinase n=1 Tax=Undibacterium sp. Di24W TaxID=3413033 RepID=UPI003BF02665
MSKFTIDPQTIETGKVILTNTLIWLSRAFDKTATWVSKLSWWKFFLFAILLLASADIIQNTFFSTEETKQAKKVRNVPKKTVITPDSSNANDDPKIEIDNTGIRIKAPEKMASNKRIDIDGSGWKTVDENQEKLSDKIESTVASLPSNNKQSDIPGITFGKDDVHIKLPKELAREIRAEMDRAKANAAAEASDVEKTKSSRWFQNFVLLLVFGLFGMKALLGGKVRAEEKAKEANASAEREALLRQVSEAQMQMMQAQVEPHFLFNTLASVEYLIETDPPRAAKMQRSLIAYLRAVLPQMRENAAKTNLGREADMVKAYLELLKMRMEERLTIDFIMPDSLRNASFPPMMLQSLVENAIKHGLEVKTEGGTLQFRAEVLQNRLAVTVRDDGLGFGAVASNGTGLGLQNIRERLKLIYKDKAQIIISPNQPSGVCVTIEIPYEIAK